MKGRMTFMERRRMQRTKMMMKGKMMKTNGRMGITRMVKGKRKTNQGGLKEVDLRFARVSVVRCYSPLQNVKHIQ